MAALVERGARRLSIATWLAPAIRKRARSLPVSA
jgi:hypothetical protein